MKRKYLRSSVTGKVLNRKGQTYRFLISAQMLRDIANTAEVAPTVEWAIEEVGGVVSTVRFVVHG